MAGGVNDLVVKVYHGTDAEFREFDLSYKATNTGWDNCIHGFFFSSKVKNAALFGDRIIEANLIMRKSIDFRLHKIFSKRDQASVVAEILFGEKLNDSKALKRLNDEIGLGIG